MKTLAVSTTLMSALLVASSGPQAAVNETAGVWQQGHAGDVIEEDQAVIEEYCVRCHSERRLRGNLSLETFDVSSPESSPEIAEAMIVKLRAGMMPPDLRNQI